MKNAISRMRRICASTIFGGALVAGALSAATPGTITVTLPHAVTVGTTTLPGGRYTLTAAEMNDGNEYFVVRGEKTPAVTLPAQKIEGGDAARTQVVFSKDGDSWHFEKLFVEGDSTGYEFK